MAGSGPGFGQLNLLQQAAGGHDEAMKAVARMALPSYREKYEGLDEELAHRRAEVWDVDGMREWALDPETKVDQETFMAAWSELFNSILTMTSATAPLFAGDKRESQVFEERIRQAAFELFLRVNNPAIRYSIIAGFEPRFREEVDEMLTRIGREIWGTAEALVQDEISIENFPPETAERLLDIAERIERAQESRGDDA